MADGLSGLSLPVQCPGQLAVGKCPVRFKPQRSGKLGARINAIRQAGFLKLDFAAPDTEPGNANT